MSGKLKHQDIPAEDLSDLGSPPAPPRGSGLSGLLATTPPAPAPPDQPPLSEARVADPAEAPPGRQSPPPDGSITAPVEHPVSHAADDRGLREPRRQTTLRGLPA